MSKLPGVARLEHVGINVARAKWADLIAFYENVFGWHIIRRQGDTIVFIGDGEGGRMELIANDVDPLPVPHHVAFVLPLDQIEAAEAALKANGATCNPIQSTPAGDKLLFFHDPAGNYMQIVARAKAMEL